MLLRPTVPTAAWPWLPLLTGYAVDKALQAAAYAAGVKWPNDVLIGERKVAGDPRRAGRDPAGPAAVVGVGLNVRSTPEELPVATATSLALESPGGRRRDRTDLLVAVLQTLREAFDALAGRRATSGACASRKPTPTPASPSVGRSGSTCPTARLPAGHRRRPGRAPGGRRPTATATAVGAGDVVHVRSPR